MSSSRTTGKNNRKTGKQLTKKSSSFHGGVPATVQEFRRPRSLPDLLSSSGKKDAWGSSMEGSGAKLTKLLLNVTLMGSVGGLQVVMPPETTVGELISCVLRQYVKEGRRPILPRADARGFDLHYSQFSLESLDRDARVMELGSRNFFLCPKKLEERSMEGGVKTTSSSSSSCNKEAENVSRESHHTWLKFLNIMLPLQQKLC